MFVKDTGNNLGRGCAIMGTGEGRVYEVVRAVEGDRYMVRHIITGRCRVVSTYAMTGLY